MSKAPGPQALTGDVVLRAGALAAVAVTALCCGVALLLEGDPAVSVSADPEWLAQLLVVAAAGLVVAWARPRNSIGWLLLVCVFLQAVSLVTAAYAQAQYADSDPQVGSFLAASTAEWTWFPSLVIPVAVLPSLYPSGRAESWTRRVFVWAGVFGIVGFCVEMGLVLGPTDLVPGLRLPYAAPAWLDGPLVVSSALALAVAVVGGMLAAFVRMLRAPAPERQQLLWLLAALAPFVVLYFVSSPVWVPGYAFFGVAVAVGVLRYRLLDIHLVVRRALFYLPLVALVALVVGVVSTAVARLAPGGVLPVLGAAAVVAVLVGPVSGWLRRTVDRFVLGDRADPLSAVGRVAAHGDRAGRGDALSSLLEALVEAIQVPYAAVLDEHGRVLAAVGSPTGTTWELELRAAGEDEGLLVLSPPADAPGRRIAMALTAHIATLLRTDKLAAELADQRRRGDAATAAERERIRSDLHDSLGPSLSGIALGLQAVDGALLGAEPAARAILRRAREEADAAVREVRRALDALGPAALDRHRLDEAVRQAADRLGFDGAHGPSFSCQVDVGGLSPGLADVAYRIIGEALHNVARHAHATECAVSLTNGGAHVHVRIRDDGVGVAATATQGMGLQSMARRAQASGGTFALRSRPEAAGTVVDVDLPLAVPG